MSLVQYQIPIALLEETFRILRQCGGGRRECQVLWVSDWSRQELINGVVHPSHKAHAGGFELSSSWITDFWKALGEADRGVRVQIHTHPSEAFHSWTDDAYPLIHSVGFLSLVIPDFAKGPVGFERAYLAEIATSGEWRSIPPTKRLRVIS